MLVVYGHGQCVNMRLYLMAPETWAREANCQSLPVDQSDRLLAYWRRRRQSSKSAGSSAWSGNPPRLSELSELAASASGKVKGRMWIRCWQPPHQIVYCQLGGTATVGGQRGAGRCGRLSDISFRWAAVLPSQSLQSCWLITRERERLGPGVS